MPTFLKYQDFIDPKKQGKYQSITIFDVDDTLIVTNSKIRVTDSNTKETFELTPAEFNEFEKYAKNLFTDVGYDLHINLNKKSDSERKVAEEVARAVVALTDKPDNGFKFVYEDDATLWDKMKAIATKIYGASDISADAKVRAEIKRLQEAGYGHYPVCVAKTQYSFSTDAARRGAPTDHTVNIREVRLAAGAEFIVMVCGDIMTMPGLPKVPSADHIDIDDSGKVVGLF